MPDNEAPKPAVEKAAAPEKAAAAADAHVPVSAGQGGVYRMVNGKRILVEPPTAPNATSPAEDPPKN